MIRAVIIGFAHMHANEIAQYINEQEDFEALQMMIAELEDKYNFAFFSEGIKLGLSLMSEAISSK